MAGSGPQAPGAAGPSRNAGCGRGVPGLLLFGAVAAARLRKPYYCKTAFPRIRLWLRVLSLNPKARCGGQVLPLRADRLAARPAELAPGALRRAGRRPGNPSRAGRGPRSPARRCAPPPPRGGDTRTPAPPRARPTGSFTCGRRPARGA